MNKLTLLLLLPLSACVTPEQFAQERAATLARAEGICQRLGITPDDSGYRKCLQSNAGDFGYKLVTDSSGQLAFVVPPPPYDMGPMGAFYPPVPVPP